MPRPKKIVQEEVKITEPVVEQDELVFEEEVPQLYVPDEEEIPEAEVALESLAVVNDVPVTSYKVYHLGNFVIQVDENSVELEKYLESNKSQLYSYIDKLKIPTTEQEDLVLFNIPATDNRKYNSLAQYYQQNGLAPQPPRINDWMTYYKMKYPMATEEEIAIQVFGPLDYSFEIA
jgi:hypothetical protein